MQQITPFLWFDSNAEEAVQHYVSIFPNAKIGTMVRYGKGGAAAAGRPEGSVRHCQLICPDAIPGQGRGGLTSLLPLGSQGWSRDFLPNLESGL